jgi:hypothetical protein
VSADGSTPDPELPSRPATDSSIFNEVVPDLVDLVNRILGVGAAVSRTIARAAELNGLGSGNSPLDEIVRNGASALISVVRMSVDGLRASTLPPATPGAPPTPAPSARPRVRAGDTLRLPLFIENPSSEPTGPLVFRALEAAAGVGEGAPTLALSQVRCEPDPLEIAARDFEKLTIFVDTAPSTPGGSHRVQVGVPGTTFVTSVEFDVLPDG